MQTDISSFIRFLAGPDGAALVAAAEALPGPEGDRYLKLRRHHAELDKYEAWFLANLPELRRRARAKFPEADRLFFVAEQLQQATARPLALYRARRFGGLSPALDLCAGLGGDALALARTGACVTAVERDPVAAACLAENARVLALDVKVVEADAEDYAGACGRFEAVMWDPSRRTEGRRVCALEDLSPPFSVHTLILSRVSDRLAAKLSPMVGPEAIPEAADVEYVSYGGECRELVAWMGAWATGRTRAVVVAGDDGRAVLFERNRIRPPCPAPVEPEVGAYVYDPDGAILRAGLLTDLAAETGLAMMDAEIAFLTGPALVRNPFVKAYRVLETMSYNEKALRRRVREMGIGRLQIIKRGFPLRPEDVLKRLRPSGPRTATLIITRFADRHRAILARPVEGEDET